MNQMTKPQAKPGCLCCDAVHEARKAHKPVMAAAARLAAAEDAYHAALRYRRAFLRSAVRNNAPEYAAAHAQVEATLAALVALETA